MNRNIAIGLVMSLGLMNAVQAAGAGDATISAGLLHISPGTDADPFETTAAGSTFTLANSSSHIPKVNTGLVTVNYYFTDQVSTEVILGAPPTIHLQGAGSISRLGELVNARLNAPVILAKYHFGENGTGFRPAIGLGLSYIRFLDIQVTSAMRTGRFLVSPTLGSTLTGRTSAKLDSTFSPVLNAALDYNFDKHWSTGIAMAYVPARTTLTLTTAAPAGTVTTAEKFRMNTLESFLSVGYTF